MFCFGYHYLSFLSEFVTSNLTSHHNFSPKAQPDSHTTILIPRASLSLVSDGSITNRVNCNAPVSDKCLEDHQKYPSLKKNRSRMLL